MSWLEIVIGAAVAALTALIVPVMRKLGELLSSKIKESETPVDDYLAGLAVKWAEDKMGDGNGGKKLESAVAKLVELSKGKIKKEQADVLVRGAYQTLFGEIQNLKN